MKNLAGTKTSKINNRFQILGNIQVGDALIVKSYRSPNLPAISQQKFKRVSENIFRIKPKKALSKKLSQQIISLYSSKGSTHLSPLNLKLSTSGQFPSTVEKTRSEYIREMSESKEKSMSRMEQALVFSVLPAKKEKGVDENVLNNDNNISCESEELNKDEIHTLRSINTIEVNRFNSPSVRKQSSKKSTVGSLISEQSIKNNQNSNFSTYNREPTIENILEELNSTEDVVVYNELKFKLITKDSILEGLHGKLLHWKVIEIIGNGSFGQVLKAICVDTGKIFAIKRLLYNP